MTSLAGGLDCLRTDCVEVPVSVACNDCDLRGLCSDCSLLSLTCDKDQQGQ